MGHYLFGGDHIKNAANLCLMSDQIPVWSGSKGMHSWERQKLGWITYTDKSTDGSVPMLDYMTADQVYRVPISSTEYFLIENRKVHTIKPEILVFIFIESRDHHHFLQQ